MRLPRTLDALLLLASLACLPASLAAQEVREEQVSLTPGGTAASIRDSIQGDESVSYLLGAEAGQTLRISLEAANASTYFNVYAPGRGPGDVAMANSGLDGPFVPEINTFDATLPTSGTYVISVYLMRAAARRDERSDYALDITLAGEPGKVVEADYADGLQGGPDFWQVEVDGRLNMRGAPSAGAEIIASLGAGERLRNLGCRMAEGRRWCQVARPDGGAEGWVAGNYLIEARNGAAPGEDGPVSSGNPADNYPSTRVEEVSVSPGGPGATRTGELLGGDAVVYMLGGQKGQMLSVELAAADDEIWFNIFAPDNTVLYQSKDGGPDGPRYRGQLYLDGTHKISVYSTTPRAEITRYELGIAVE